MKTGLTGRPTAPIDVCMISTGCENLGVKSKASNSLQIMIFIAMVANFLPGLLWVEGECASAIGEMGEREVGTKSGCRDQRRLQNSTRTSRWKR